MRHGRLLSIFLLALIFIAACAQNDRHYRFRRNDVTAGDNLPEEVGAESDEDTASYTACPFESENEKDGENENENTAKRHVKLLFPASHSMDRRRRSAHHDSSASTSTEHEEESGVDVELASSYDDPENPENHEYSSAENNDHDTENDIENLANEVSETNAEETEDEAVVNKRQTDNHDRDHEHDESPETEPHHDLPDKHPRAKRVSKAGSSHKNRGGAINRLQSKSNTQVNPVGSTHQHAHQD